MEDRAQKIHLSSGSLQELWDTIRDACTSQHAITIDLEGQEFTGPVAGLHISICRGTRTMYDKALHLSPTHPLTLQNGTITLKSRYSMVVAGGEVFLKDVVLRGEGMDWRKRDTACLLHARGQGTCLSLQQSEIHCSAPEPVSTILIDGGACVKMTASKVSHSSQALGCRLAGGTLEALDSQFSGRHENITILTPKPAAASPAGAAAAEKGSMQQQASAALLEGCSLEGDGRGSLGAAAAVIGNRSSLSATNCQMRGGAVGLIVSRGGWLVLDGCHVSETEAAGIWCSGAHVQAAGCTFMSHQQSALKVERKGQLEMKRCTFWMGDATSESPVAVAVDGAGSFARAVDCSFADYDATSAFVGTAGGAYLTEQGVEDAIKL